MADAKDDHRETNDTRDLDDAQRAAYLRRYFPTEQCDQLQVLMKVDPNTKVG